MDAGAVYVQDTVSTTPIPLPKTPNMAYPTWSAAGDFIVTENGESLAGYPTPRTTKIDPASGTVIAQVMGSPLVWGGMPTVDLRDSARIAFAGQWIGSQTGYDQDRNYIWLADDAWQIDRGMAPVRPLDPQANATGAFRAEFQATRAVVLAGQQMGCVRIHSRRPERRTLRDLHTECAGRRAGPPGDRCQVEREPRKVLSGRPAAGGDAAAEAGW